MVTRKRRKTKRGTNVIGFRIRQLREQLVPAASQADIAARLSVRGLQIDRPTVTRIENGERYLRDYEIVAFAKVLGVSCAKLFGEPQK